MKDVDNVNLAEILHKYEKSAQKKLLSFMNHDSWNGFYYAKGI